MFSDKRESFGKMRFLLESNREYYSFFKQTQAESRDYICEEQTETALGQHLLDFLETSSSAFAKITERYHTIDDYLTHDYMDYDRIQYYMNFIQELYQDLADMNVVWKSVVFNSRIFFHYRWYKFYATREYLQDSAPVEEGSRMERMKLHWEQTRKAILEEINLFDMMVSFINSMGNAVTFCLDNSAFPELADMHTIKRSYLYQTLFDTRFLREDSMKISFHLAEKNSILPEKVITVNSRPLTPKEQLFQSTFSSKNYFNLFQNTDSRKTYSRYLDVVEAQDIELSLTLDIRTIEDLYTACLYSFFILATKNIHVRRCRHCGKYFSPYNRSDEVYCSRVLEKGKSCRSLYNEYKLQSDELTRYYRNAYKTRNARKQRNMKNKPSSEKEFQEWKKKAQKALKQAKNNEISFEEFKKIIDAQEKGG